eukprot:463594-Rhodomonas_salina.1
MECALSGVLAKLSSRTPNPTVRFWRESVWSGSVSWGVKSAGWVNTPGVSFQYTMLDLSNRRLTMQ